MTLAPEELIACPHCRSLTVADAAFCEGCGKALPGPRLAPAVVDEQNPPRSNAGKILLSGELQKQTHTAAITLLVIGIIQVVVGGFILAALLQTNRFGVVPSMVKLIIVVQCIVGAIFLGLFFWARRAPLPASIAGLVIYCTLVALNILNAVNNLSHVRAGRPQNGLGGLGVGWLDIVIIVFLSRGISAALKQRRLESI